MKSSIFARWLQEESGYNANEKKTILQRITEWLNDIIEAIRDIMNSGELNGAGKFFAKENCDELTKIRKQFLEALDGAGENYREGGAVEGGVRNSLKDKKITPDMSEKDRTEVLKNTELNIAKYDGNDELNGASVLKLKSSYNSEASKILKTLGEKFGVFKGYTNNNVELEFEYSRGSLNESVHKQGDISTNFYDFARMLYVFDDVIKNAVPIDIHTDKYKGTMREDRNLKYDYVLFSAFSDGNHIIPVELHIKEYKTTKIPNKLYVSITLGKIKIEDNVKVQTADKNQRNNTQLSSFISLPQLISKINPEYGNFYKYIPKSLLNELQIKSKEIAEEDEDYRLKVMRGEDVSHILKDKAHQKGYDTDFSYRMDHRAPNAKYDTCITDIDRAYGGDGSIYSQYAAHYYGDGRTYDYKAINVIKKARSSPESLITIYRAVPTNVKDTRIRNGDWVTIVKDYADEHGWRTLDDDYRIIENKVPAKYLFTDGNSIHEFGYDNGNTNEVYKNTDNNVKVTEVTYDERGQLIPLSKRFDDGKSDIRYSLPLSNLNDLHRSNIEKVTELSRVAAQLTAHINYIGSSQTKRTLSTLNIQAVARELKKEYQSKADIHELTAELESLYKLFEQGRVSSDVVKAHVDSIVEKIINESVYMKPDISDYAKEILRELRGVKFKLSDVQKQQAAYHFGSYNEFRKALMGSVVLSEEGTPLDERWQSLCGMFPGRFDSETVDTDQPYALFEAIKELRNTYDDESGLDIDSVKAQLSADICAGYISIPTVAQYSNQYSVLEQELLQSLKAEKQMYKQIYSESYKKAQSEYGVQLKKLRAEQAEEILRAKARMEQRVENIADTRLREKKRNRLIKTIKRLDRLLRNPGKGAPSAGTNKYGQDYVHLTNIPEGFKKAVIDFCYIFIENDAGVFTAKYKDSEDVVRKKVFELLKQYGALKESKTIFIDKKSQDNEI